MTWNPPQRPAPQLPAPGSPSSAAQRKDLASGKSLAAVRGDTRRKLTRATQQKQQFLVAYAQCGTITEAARVTGIPRQYHSAWCRDDPDYALATKEAEDQAVELLENEARRRAFEGVEKPVYQGGKLVGKVREYSDTLLIFLIKGGKPHKYRDNSPITLNAQGPVQVNLNV